MAKLFSLKKNTDFRKVYQRGNSLADKYLVIYWFSNKEGVNRFGYSISKKVGGAVVRNRLRRLLKEICRKHQDQIPKGLDIVVITRLPVVGKSFDQIERSFLGLLKKAKIFGQRV